MKFFKQEMINEHVARAIFASGCPLNLVENSYWQKALEILRPAYKLPSRFLLSNVYLDREYDRIKCKCKDYVQKASSVAILCDGWTNIRYAVSDCMLYLA